MFTVEMFYEEYQFQSSLNTERVSNKLIVSFIRQFLFIIQFLDHPDDLHLRKKHCR